MLSIKTIEVNKEQLENILSFTQCRLTMLNSDGLDISTGDNIIFTCDGKTACARVTDSVEKHIQDVEYGEMYDEGIRPEVPGILSEEVSYPEGFDKWSKEKQDTWFNDRARATYIAQRKLAYDLYIYYKIYWDSIVSHINFDKLRYDANPIIKNIRFEVM